MSQGAVRSTLAYAPTTFDERGVAVPFTTPVLAQGRIRKAERAGNELLVANLSGGAGIYVLPWQDVPALGGITIHDRALHEALASLQKPDPEQVRKVSLDVAVSGLAGPEVANAALARRHEDEEAVQLTHLLLILEVLGRYDVDTSALRDHRFRPSDIMAQARTALTDTAGRMGIAAEALYDRLAAMAQMLAPYRPAQTGAVGRQRRLLNDLAVIRDEIQTWANGDGSESSFLGSFAATQLHQTVALCQEALKPIDQAINAIDRVLVGWEKVAPRLAANCSRVNWLLDGWPFVLTLWRESADQSPRERRQVVELFFRFVPLFPTREARKHTNPSRARMDGAIQRSVRAAQGWLSDDPDLDLVARIETMKAKLS